MKLKYIQPETQAISLLPKDGILLSGSNQGYTIDSFDPGFAPSSIDGGISFNGGEELFF